MDFVRKDLSSEWSKAHAIEVHLREGSATEAIRIGAPKIPHWDSYKMLLACANIRRRQKSRNWPLAWRWTTTLRSIISSPGTSPIVVRRCRFANAEACYRAKLLLLPNRR